MHIIMLGKTQCFACVSTLALMQRAKPVSTLFVCLSHRCTGNKDYDQGHSRYIITFLIGFVPP